MMILLFLLVFLMQELVTVSSFTPQALVCKSKSHTHQLYAKRRGGAMANRKKKKQSSDTSDSKGFSQAIDEEQQASTTPADNIYSLPPLYDLAFGYRNYDEEVDFLLDVHEKYSKTTNTEAEGINILELAAGPARHSLSALSQHPPSEVSSMIALDLNKDMVIYGSENADYELGIGGGRRDDFKYVKGDMRYATDYTTKILDSAWLLLGSMQHLLTNEDIISCLSSLHSIIKPGGTVIIELPHPRETFCMGEMTKNGWCVPLEDDEEKEYGKLDIIWGDENDVFDEINQIRNFTVGLSLTVNDVNDIPKDEDISPLFLQMSKDGKTSIKEIVPMRLFTLQEIDLLARCSGFDLVAKYGALSEDVAIDNEEEGYRMVCILRRRDSK